MIHCDKCKTVNPPEQRYCINCRRDLLPGTGFGVRFFAFLFSLAVAAVGVWILWRISTGFEMPDLGCFLTSPIWWGLMVVVMPVVGIIFLVKRTPIHERYFDRAKRHVNLDRDQALADFNEAIRLAPEKARLPILKERAKLFEVLGQGKEALRDKIAAAEDSGAHDTSGNVASMFGADKDTFIRQMQEQDRSALKMSGAIAVGYCRRCRMVVELDAKSHCPMHPHTGISNIHLAVPEDVASVKANITDSRNRANRKRRIGWIVFILGLLLLYLVFRYILLI